MRMSHVVDVLQDFCESKPIFHNGSFFHVQHGKTYQQVKIGARPVSPQDFPNPHDVTEGKLSFEPNEEPSKAEEQVARVLGIQVAVELRIIGLEELCQLIQLVFHAALVKVKVGRHSLHEAHKAPKCIDFVLHDIQQRSQQIRHSLKDK